MRGPINWYRAIPLGLRERTGRIVVPTLFIWSEGDPFVSWAAARRCGDFVTGPYHLEVLNGTSHWLPEQAPDQVAALLAAHFARARGG
jgi:pimeloyl-ACP methyl ester carboxylesterase